MREVICDIPQSSCFGPLLFILKRIVTLIKFSPKRENILEDIISNIDADKNVDEAPGVSKFSMTRWTVRENCFNRIYLNYQALQDTWSECLDEGGLNSELRGRMIGVKAQMNTFIFFFGIQLANRLFSHTDNLSRTLQSKRICDTDGHRIANQTVSILKGLRGDYAVQGFWATVMKKKDMLPDIDMFSCSIN